MKEDPFNLKTQFLINCQKLIQDTSGQQLFNSFEYSLTLKNVQPYFVNKTILDSLVKQEQEASTIFSNYKYPLDFLYLSWTSLKKDLDQG